VTAILGLYRHGALIQSFVRRDLQARYRGSAIGFLWSVIHPLIMLVLYTLVFATILRVRVGPDEGTEQFAIYLFCGLLPWNAVAEGLTRATGVILEHANLIKRAVFPSEILPVYPVISAIVHELIGLAILVAALLASGHGVAPSFLALPLVLLLQFALATGLAWLVAGATVFIRDLGQLLGMALTLWLFLTPIFYPPSLVPDGLRALVIVNPMHILVEAYRSLVLKGQLPPWDGLTYLAACAGTAFLAGHWAFTRMQPAFADVI